MTSERGLRGQAAMICRPQPGPALIVATLRVQRRRSGDWHAWIRFLESKHFFHFPRAWRGSALTAKENIPLKETGSLGVKGCGGPQCPTEQNTPQQPPTWNEPPSLPSAQFHDSSSVGPALVSPQMCGGSTRAALRTGGSWWEAFGHTALPFINTGLSRRSISSRVSFGSWCLSRNFSRPSEPWTGLELFITCPWDPFTILSCGHRSPSCHGSLASYFPDLCGSPHPTWGWVCPHLWAVAGLPSPRCSNGNGSSRRKEPLPSSEPTCLLKGRWSFTPPLHPPNSQSLTSEERAEGTWAPKSGRPRLFIRAGIG